MTDQPTRVRFAPSPTGFLNLGGARSALFNWLYARKTGGEFLLRIEDTDRTRLVKDAEQQITASLEWLGITPAEVPQRQSERLELYKNHAQQLAEKGILYPCWCSPERLAGLRQAAQADKKAFKYDRYCLSNPGDPNQPHVLRFKIPDRPEQIAWQDAVKGPVEMPAETIDDFVAIKSDGYPTYHFANVVDDHDMQISHVLRADEWVASTPKHLLLYRAFGWQPPVYAHLPAVLGTSGGKKLSKRYGAESVLYYRDEGYLPEAVVNFLALLGWNPGEGSTQEIFTAKELVAAFSLDNIQASPAVLDPERLDWMNGIYIRNLSLDELYRRSQGFWPKAAASYDDGYKKQVLALVQERLKFLAELGPLTDFFFADPAPNAALLTKNLAAGPAKDLLGKLTGQLQDNDFSEAALEQDLRQFAQEQGLKPGHLFGLIRAAVTGREAAPGLFETLAVLGKEAALHRLKSAQAVI